MDRKVVIIPTYNEKENIEKIIRAVMDLEGEYNILVIEDGSPDGTADIVRRLQKEFVLLTQTVVYLILQLQYLNLMHTTLVSLCISSRKPAEFPDTCLELIHLTNLV